MKKGSDFESFVHYVYSSIISLEDNSVLVSKNAVITGRSGAKHEIDVYYEFTKANIVHRVAIECKDYKNPVSKGRVTEFYGKISDIDNLTGVIVTRVGYQSGAKEFAEHYGIKILTIDDLPTLPEILSLQLSQAFLPHEKVIGQPFWALMETIDGNVTGTYVCAPSDSAEKIIPLFYSKRVAEKYLSCIEDKHAVVRGINQQQLKALLTMIEQTGQNDVGFVVLPFVADSPDKWMAISVSLDQLKEEYVVKG